MSEYPWNGKNNTFKWLSSLYNPFKTDFQKDEISCAKYFISIHMQTLALKCSQKFQDKKKLCFEN